MGFGGMRKAVYSCTALAGTNKAGKLKANADGYYTLSVGALNAFNSGGAYYPLGPAKKIFEGSSSLMRRIQNGNCKGEMGHPKPTPGMSMRDFIGRVSTIEETRVCCHFRRVWLEEQGHKDAQGRPIVAIMAEVKPSGPLGDSLKASFDNPSENVCFSIRSLTNDQMSPRGHLEKNITSVVTFDVVTEGGISSAHKYAAPGLESISVFDDMDDVTIVPEHLAAIEQQYRVAGVAVEDTGIYDIRRDLGWDQPKTLSQGKRVSMRW